MNEKIENKLIPTQETYINIPNLLTGTIDEQRTQIINFFLGWSNKTKEEVQHDFLSLYKEFIHTVTKSEDFQSSDPYESVTGESFEKQYLTPNSSKTGEEVLFSPLTLIVPSNKLYMGSLIYDIEQAKNFSIDTNLFSGIPLVSFNDKNLELHFGFLKTALASNIAPGLYDEISFGTLGIEESVVDEIKFHPSFEVWQRKLQELAVWFNHDITAHATLLPGQQQSEFIKNIHTTNTSNELLGDFYASVFNYGEETELGFAGEFWSLALQSDIMKNLIEKRPAIGRFMRMHLNSYLRLVDEITENIQDTEKKNAYKIYLQKVYAFMFLRLIDPKEFHAVDGDYVAIAEKYPDFTNAPSYEEQLRKEVHTAGGMKVKKDDTITHIPHKELFNKLAPAIEEYSIFHEALTILQKNEAASESLVTVQEYLKEHPEAQEHWTRYIHSTLIDGLDWKYKTQEHENFFQEVNSLEHFLRKYPNLVYDITNRNITVADAVSIIEQSAPLI